MLAETTTDRGAIQRRLVTRTTTSLEATTFHARQDDCERVRRGEALALRGIWS